MILLLLPMKKTKKSKTPPKVIKELAAHFEEDLKKSLPIVVHPNGAITYENYGIIKLPSDNWGLFDLHSKDLINQFYLKTCAIMAAKAYNSTKLEKFFEIKRLDNRYWAFYCDHQIYKENITKTKEFSRYMILLNKLEYSQEKADYYKSEISRMFKFTFA